jgi:hypothetical protein
VGYLEILDRSGRVAQRVGLTGSALTLGRAYDNDVILDDPYVCPHHLRISWADGHLTAEDLESVNGIVSRAGTRDDNRIRVGSGDSFRVGRTVLRYRDPSYSVAAARVDRSQRSLLRLFDRRAPLAALYIFAVAATAWGAYVETIDEPVAAELAFLALGLPAAVLAWAGFWAFASKLAVHRWSFFSHCGIACAGVIGLTLIETGISYAQFAFALDRYHSLTVAAAYPPLAAFLLYAHLRYATSASRRRIALATCGMIIGLFGLVFLSSHLPEKEFTGSPRYTATLKAPAFRWAKAKTPESFFEQVEEVRKAVETAVNEDE